jgi:hypothetical protein
LAEEAAYQAEGDVKVPEIGKVIGICGRESGSRRIKRGLRRRRKSLHNHSNLINLKP